MFRVIIAGTRTFENYSLLCEYVDFKLSKVDDEIEIVSGGARGADLLGERYAKEHGYKLRVFPAQWSIYGKRSGPMRNAKMAKYADALIVLWDGKSPGTKNMIDEAKKNGLKIAVKMFV